MYPNLFSFIFIIFSIILHHPILRFVRFLRLFNAYFFHVDFHIFLSSLRKGGTLLHYLWAVHSMEEEEKLPESDYLLPSGASPLWPYYVFTITRPPPAYGVLSCLRVLNLADSSWSINGSTVIDDLITENYPNMYLLQYFFNLVYFVLTYLNSFQIYFHLY